MVDAMNKVVSLGLGLLSLTREKVEKFANELAQKGELKRQEVNKFVDELLKRGEEERGNLRMIVRNEVERLIGELGIATKRDLQELEERVKGLLGSKA